MKRMRFCSEPPYSSLRWLDFFREEFVHEIAVGAMQLQHLEAGCIGAARGIAPGLHEVLDLATRERARRRPLLAMGDRAWRDGRPFVPIVDLGRARQRPVAFPRPPRARLAAGMAELDAGGGILLLDEFDEAAERLDELVVPDAEIADGAAAAPLDLCRFDHNQPDAAGRELAGIHQMPVGRKALFGRVLMHRRHHDAVLQGDAADRHR
jgi:hypothetical protein